MALSPITRGPFPVTGSRNRRAMLRPIYSRFSTPPALTDGQVRFYDMSDGSGTTVTDLSGNGNGTLSGTPSWGSDGTSSYIDLDGTDDYVNIGNPSISSTDFEMLFWVNFDALTTGDRLFSPPDGSNETPAQEITIALSYSSADVVDIYETPDVAWTPMLTGLSTATNYIIRFAYVHSTQTATMWLNGVEGASKVYGTAKAMNGGSFYIGKPFTASGELGTFGNFMEGKVRAYRLWSRVLTSGERAIVDANPIAQ